MLDKVKKIGKSIHIVITQHWIEFTIIWTLLISIMAAILGESIISSLYIVANIILIALHDIKTAVLKGQADMKYCIEKENSEMYYV